MPNEREWLTNLTCVNAAGESIPGFYIFRGKRIRDNYLAHCEDGAVMAMQEQAWMTTTLFSHWISHFIRSLNNKGGISREETLTDSRWAQLTRDIGGGLQVQTGGS